MKLNWPKTTDLREVAFSAALSVSLMPLIPPVLQWVFIALWWGIWALRMYCDYLQEKVDALNSIIKRHSL